jgi:hypothetical protein
MNIEDNDPELLALNQANNAIKDLPEEARGRIVAWLINKYSIQSPYSQKQSSSDTSQKVLSEPSSSEEAEAPILNSYDYDTAAEFLSKCKTATDSQRALAISAYLQEKQGKRDLTGYEINHELQQIGYKASNITKAIKSLSGKKPQLMIQTKKAGTSRQAKKNYKVTEEGLKEVQRMITENSSI